MAAAATIRKAVFATAFLLWGASIFYGARVLLQYETGAGKPGDAPAKWPNTSTLSRAAGRFALVMVAHPDCPCTSAGIQELEQLVARLGGRLDAFVVFRKPEATREETQASRLWNKAAAIRGVKLLHDATGEETRHFGAWVSGQTMLYDPEGRLVFRGGLSNARGREGYSRGEDEVIRIVNGASAGLGKTPVFGCSLHDPDEQQLSEEPSWAKR